jgi:broad specificity polyphosphatase/5'/3'-nucleotidase SurE
MKNKNKNVSRRQAIKGISAVALGTTASGTTALAASSRNKKKEKTMKTKPIKNLMEKQLSLRVVHEVLVWQALKSLQKQEQISFFLM